MIVNLIDFGLKQILENQRKDSFREKAANYLQIKRTEEKKAQGSKKQTKAFEKNMEKYVRQACEQLFGCEFKKVRNLPWLKNPYTGRQLEIDCYNEELRLGVENDGRHHVEYVSAFYKNEAEFIAQKDRDHIKNFLCAQAGVKLLRVPHYIKRKEIKSHLLSEYLSLLAQEKLKT